MCRVVGCFVIVMVYIGCSGLRWFSLLGNVKLILSDLQFKFYFLDLTEILLYIWCRLYTFKFVKLNLNIVGCRQILLFHSCIIFCMQFTSFFGCPHYLSLNTILDDLQYDTSYWSIFLLLGFFTCSFLVGLEIFLFFLIRGFHL